VKREAACFKLRSESFLVRQSQQGTCSRGAYSPHTHTQTHTHTNILQTQKSRPSRFMRW